MNLIDVGELDRRTYLGGSDAAAILGLSPWKTPIDVFMSKQHNYQEDITPEKQKIFNRGKFFEPYILNEMAKELNLKVTHVNRRFRHPKYEFIAAEIDAETEDCNIEIKTVNHFAAKQWGRSFSDEIPVHYAIQAFHGLAVTGRDKCLFAVLFNIDELRFFEIKRNEKLIEKIINAELDFWENLQKNSPPAILTKSDVLSFFGTADDGQAIEATEKIDISIASMRQLSKEIKELQVEYDRHLNAVTSFMGNKQTLRYRGDILATWRETKSKRIDVKQLGKEYPDIAAKLEKETLSRRFLLK